MDRELGVVTPTQNQKITWAVELFGDNEDLCFMYRYATFYFSLALYSDSDVTTVRIVAVMPGAYPRLEANTLLRNGGYIICQLRIFLHDSLNAYHDLFS